MTSRQKAAFILAVRWFSPTAFVHGDCVGADADAHALVDFFKDEFGVQAISIRPSTLRTRAWCTSEIAVIHKPKDPLFRNVEIVKESDVLIGCPKGFEEEKKGSGTWHAIRVARNLRKPVLVIWPNGKVETR